jgi:transposase
MSMGKRNGLSRGDARRNARLIRIRGIVRGDRAILAIDLADTKQVLALCDHDLRVLARRTGRGRAWHLDEALRWARATAIEHGFAGIVVGCEPTGHRWRIVAELCDRLGIDLVCVQPLLVGRAREQEDLTRDKSDPKDAVLIGRLVGQLRCYLPERTDQVWARLRQLGARRQALTTSASASRQQLRDLLECAWPAVLEAAAEPLDSATWRVALQVALDRAGPTGELAALGQAGYARFARQVARALACWGGRRRCLRIVRAVWTAAISSTALATGVDTQRPGALERARLTLEDWHHTLGQLADTDQRMTGVLDQLQLTGLVGSIPGLSAVGAAAILAETGDPTRFDTARALVNTPACAPATTSPAPTPAPPPSPAEAGPPCGWPPGGRPGAHWHTTRSWPPATPTSPPAPTPAHHRPGPHRAGRGPAAVAVGRGHHPHSWQATIAAGRPSPARRR